MHGQINHIESIASIYHYASWNQRKDRRNSERVDPMISLEVPRAYKKQKKKKEKKKGKPCNSYYDIPHFSHIFYTIITLLQNFVVIAFIPDPNSIRFVPVYFTPLPLAAPGDPFPQRGRTPTGTGRMTSGPPFLRATDARVISSAN